MRNRWFLPAALSVLLLLSALVWCQQLTIQTGRTKVVLARADIEALPRIKVMTGASGMSTTYEGVPLKAVLQKAGIGFGEALKKKRMASCLLVEAADGYRAWAHLYA